MTPWGNAADGYDIRALPVSKQQPHVHRTTRNMAQMDVSQSRLANG